MADNPEPQAVPAVSEKNRRFLPLAVVGLLMLGEGVGVFFAVKFFFSAPEQAFADSEGHGSEGMPAHAESSKADLVVLELAQCTPINRQTGKLITIQIRVSALIPGMEKERLEEFVEAHRAQIEDRVNFVIRSADIKHLNEPNMETIKRRLKEELDVVFEDETLIRKVLIPQYIQSGSGL